MGIDAENEAEAMRREQRQRRMQVANLVAVLILLAVVTAVAIGQWRQAERKIQEADSQKAAAETQLDRAQDSLAIATKTNQDLLHGQADALMATTDTLLKIGEIQNALA